MADQGLHHVELPKGQGDLERLGLVDMDILEYDGMIYIYIIVVHKWLI